MGSIRMGNQTEDKPKPCIWMQGGVVRRKFCNIDYDCTPCRYDRALRCISSENQKRIKAGKALEGKRGKIIFWKQKLRELPVWKRPCTHHLKGRINFRTCTNDYRCGDCEFDQYFHDQYTVHAVVKSVDALDIKGFKVPHGYYLHKGHAWAKIEEGNSVRIGLDDFALRILGPPDKVESPLVGKTVKQNRADIILSRGEKIARILSPVSGVITDINPKLRETGSLANESPYSTGWVFRVHSDNLRQDLKNLMMGKETEDFVGGEVDRLYEVIEETAGPLAADGGNLVKDIYGAMPDLGWWRLTKLFLRT